MVDELSEKELQERMKLMKENCIFCKIAKKEIDSKIIFEDDICMAILDISPITIGHLLLFPKEHYVMMPVVPNEVLGHLGIISEYLSDLLKETFSVKNVSIFIANGVAAGQLSQHFLIHIIPRYENDGIDFNFDTGDSDKKLSEEELNELSNKLKSALENGVVS